MVDLAKLLSDIEDDIELNENLGLSAEFSLRCKVAIRELAAERDALKAELEVAKDKLNKAQELADWHQSHRAFAEAQLEAARKQEPAIYRLRYTEATSGWVDVTKEVYDRHKDSQNYDARVFYASPVPAQQPEISFDIQDFTEEELLRLTNLLQKRELIRAPAQQECTFHGADAQACMDYSKEVPCEFTWEQEAKRAFWSGLEIGATFGSCAILPRWNEYIEKRKSELKGGENER